MSKNDNATEKKTAILGAATRLLKTSGLQTLSFEAIAAEAGLSRQLVRYYYPNLEQLMLELCDHYGQVYTAILTQGVVKVGAVERLDFFMDFFFGLAEEHEMPDHLEVYDALVAFSVGSDAFRERLCGQYNTLGQVMMHEFAIAHPDLSQADCKELSYLFVSMMHAHWSFVASLGHSPDHGRLTRRAFGRVIDSYLADKNTRPTIPEPWARSNKST